MPFGPECGPTFGFTAFMTFATLAFRTHGFRILGLRSGRSKGSSSQGPMSPVVSAAKDQETVVSASLAVIKAPKGCPAPFAGFHADFATFALFPAAPCPPRLRTRKSRAKRSKLGWPPVSILLSHFMDSLAINLVNAEKLDAVAALFEAQLREHKITTPRDDLRMVIWTVIADQRHGFMLEASVPDGSPIAVAYASSLLSLEHGGVSGWLEELYVLPQWRGRGIGSRLVGEVIAHARELGWRALDLEVEASHQRAISLYVRHQFQPHSLATGREWKTRTLRGSGTTTAPGKASLQSYADLTPTKPSLKPIVEDKA
jgi:ribosomal protein S18 acetylase RimI-like enzyme